MKTYFVVSASIRTQNIIFYCFFNIDHLLIGWSLNIMIEVDNLLRIALNGRSIGYIQLSEAHQI